MTQKKHLVAIFGGAVSGAEAAAQLAENGIESVVFEQNALPYGKIEDGLPKWHVKLRDKEEGRINEKISSPLVHYVPLCALGRDISFEEVVSDGRFSAVLLATGAWRDRPLPIEGIEDFEYQGLAYQNPFIYWFNHNHEPEYNGQKFDIVDGAIIIGGGLASLDVAKVLMFETVQKALKERGHDIDLFTMDRGINRVLDDLGLSLNDLGIKGCTLYYRRRIMDMPLSPAATDTPEQLAKAQAVREKILTNYQNKFLFNVEANYMPVDKIVEDGDLKGIRFQKTEVRNEKLVPVEGEYLDARADLIISSIGSLPELIPGVPAKYQVFDIEDDAICRVRGYKHVFALGNAVTGRGNINESMKHGREISQKVIEEHLGKMRIDKNAQIDATVEKITETVEQNALSEEQYAGTIQMIKQLQAKVGYDNNFDAWVNSHLPPRLEHLLGINH